MKKKIYLRTQKNAIPGGEGLNALPTAFVCHISLQGRLAPKAISCARGGCFAGLGLDMHEEHGLLDQCLLATT